MLGTGADRLCTPSTSAGPFRIFAVAGFNNRSNDVVYCPPIIRQSSHHEPTAVVYFGGDVQDFPESMETNRDSRGYMKYNLENSAILLREAFPRSHIIVIRPVRMEFKTFSCFDNFVRGNNAGVPDHTPMNHALQHLEKLLQNLSHRLIHLPESEILEQAANAAASTAHVAAVTAAAMGLPNSNSSDSNNASTTTKTCNASSSSSVPTTITHITNHTTTKTSKSDSHHEMDIDIVQVQEISTVNTAGASTPNSSNEHRNGKEVNSVEIPSNSHSVNNGINNDCNNIDRKHHDGDSDNLNDADAFDEEMRNCDSPQPDQFNNPLWWRENLNLDKAKLYLVGFSKGCVVLNQFIYEFHYLKTLTPDDSTMGRLLSRIKDMYWLDGGHGGQKNTWITSRSLLETLTRMGINVQVHLTPYQVQDERRPWIRKEEKLFSDMLKRLGCTLTRQLHYENATPNLVTHFEVLHAFCQCVHQNQQQQQQQNQQKEHQNQINEQNQQLQQQQQQQNHHANEQNQQQQLSQHQPQQQQQLFQNDHCNNTALDDNINSEEK